MFRNEQRGSSALSQVSETNATSIPSSLSNVLKLFLLLYKLLAFKTQTKGNADALSDLFFDCFKFDWLNWIGSLSGSISSSVSYSVSYSESLEEMDSLPSTCKI